MASESEDGVDGHLMVTAPQNIRSKANESESGRVEGVGRTFLQFASEEIRKRNKNKLVLTPAESAKPFYKKFGFDFTEGERNISKNFAEPEILSKL